MDTPRPRRIGIIGGMGPEATVHLMARIIAFTSARDDADHVPLIVDNNTQVPSRIKWLIEGTGDDPAPVLAEMAKGLERAGAVALAMPCNTAHLFAPAIRAAATVPFLDMVALTIERVVRRSGAGVPVGILASPAVKRTGLFDKGLAEHGIDALYPRDQDRMLAAIRAIKRRSSDPLARLALNEAATELVAAGASSLIIGCSEFSIARSGIEAPCEIIDSLDVLAEAIVAFATAPSEPPPGADSI